MFIVSGQLRRTNIRSEFNIYENVAEFEGAQSEYNLNLSTPERCVEHDYLRTDNGYYVPVLSVKEYDFKRNVIFRLIQLPRRYLKLYVYKSTGDARKYEFVYDRETITRPAKRYINARDKFMIQLIITGKLTFYEAYDKVYGKPTYTRALRLREHKLTAIINSPSFIKYLEDNMDIKKTAEKAGMDGTWYAKKLMSILDDPKSPANVKIRALDGAHSILTLPDRDEKVTDKVRNSESYMDEISKKSGLKIAGGN